jgi:diguanylate cyclase (GGDEF)-like protein
MSERSTEDELAKQPLAIVAVAAEGLAREVAEAAEACGFRVHFSRAGSLVADARKQSPQLVLIDSDLPGSAIDACRQLRRSGTAPSTAQLLFLTDTSRLLGAAFAAGIDDFVSKPFDADTLRSRILVVGRHAENANKAATRAIEEHALRLERAHGRAGIAHWEWDVSTNQVHLGPGAMAVMRIQGERPSDFDDLLDACVHTEDQEKLCRELLASLHGRREADGVVHRLPVFNLEPRFLQHFPVVTEVPGRGKLVTVSVRDVTNDRRNEEQANRLAFYDELTGLQNRRMFERRLNAAIERFRNSDDAVALLFVDLNGFKQVNDRLGHAVGDELLRTVASRLIECVRPTDEIGRFAQGSAARLGGDEFALLLTGLTDPRAAQKVAVRIRELVRAPVEAGNQVLEVSASVGIAYLPRDGRTADALLNAADSAMYAAKQDPTTDFHEYAPGTAEAEAYKVGLLAKLMGAVERNEFRIVVQPRVCLRTGRLLGGESLARWQHPELGLVMPKDFILLAEERGLIEPIGAWILDAACAEAAKWSALTPDPLSISVNVSRAQLRKGSIDALVASALVKHALAPMRLELEVTESMMDLGEETLAPLRRLRDTGVSLALDDFGSGYASLSSLIRFPVGVVKLDRTIIREIEVDPDAQCMLRAVIRMAHELGRRVVAEGVDSPGQLTFLRAAECDEVQGFLISEPLHPHEFRELIRRWNPAEAFPAVA